MKRKNSSTNANKSSKFTKLKHLINTNIANVNTQTQEMKTTAATSTVATSTQIWPPCQITRDSQTT